MVALTEGLHAAASTEAWRVNPATNLISDVGDDSREDVFTVSDSSGLGNCCCWIRHPATALLVALLQGFAAC
jgi:hypothetical protein